jgi:hypothetical protein
VTDSQAARILDPKFIFQMSIYQSLLCGVFNRTLRTKNSSQSVTDSQVARILDPIFIFQMSIYRTISSINHFSLRNHIPDQR